MSIHDTLLRELNRRKEVLNKDILDLDGTKKTRGDEISKLEKEIDLIKSRISEEKEQLEYLSQEITEREATKGFLEIRISDKQKEVEKLNLDVESNLSILKNIEEKTTDLDKSIKKYQIEFDDGTKTILSKDEMERSYVSESFDLSELKELSYKYPISIADIMRLAEIARDEILEWVDKKRIPGKIYKELARENEPLPSRLYTDQKMGKGWAQMHFRFIPPDDYNAFKSGKKSLIDILVGRSVHIDLRISYPEQKTLTQFVITDSDIQSVVRMMKGEKRETAGGVMNVQHSLVVSKPSSEPPEESPERFYSKSVDPESSKPAEYSPSINKEGAQLAGELDLGESSYWISPNNVGSSKDKYAYMMHIWSGDVITGCERYDLHELFLSKKHSNDDIFDGKFTIKCLKRPDKTARWEIWRSITEKGKKPMDSIMHSDISYHYLAPASKIEERFGREAYREQSQKLFRNKLK